MLALLTVAPWILLVVYDFLLYIWRSATYEMPVIGGRARGKGRPRAPSLTQRPGGEKRMLGVLDMPQLTPVIERMEPILEDAGRAVADATGIEMDGVRGRQRTKERAG